MSRLHRPARSLAHALVVVLLTACGGETTPPAENPTPDVRALLPAFAYQGSNSTEITLTGSDFVASSVVRVNGANRPTTYVSRTELRAAFLSGDFASFGSLQVQVFNPAPGGGLSNTMLLEVVQPINPAPTVTGVSPASVTAGASSATVTIQGTGFTGKTTVAVNGQAHTGTTLISPTSLQVTLTSSQLASARISTITVANPAPGGGIASTTVEIRSPAPTLSSLGTTQTEAGLPQLTLRVTGTGFLSTSVGRVNEAPRPTTYINSTTLDVVVQEGDLSTAGTLGITVVNPAPGGGTSASLSLQVVNGAPVLLELPSRGASAGRPGFSLTVHGRGFTSASVVRWNGTARPTQYVSGRRLVAEISSGDVASPGTAHVTVFTPAPGGGTSAAIPMTIRSIGAPTASSSRAAALHANDLAVDDARGLIYLSIRSSAPVDANSVVGIDPATGAVTRRVFVGSGPARLARTDDGQYLYVGLNGASAIRRVNLSTFAASLQWSLPSGQVAGEMLALPGLPGSVVVSRQTPGYSPPLAGVTVYDEGTARPQSAPGHTGGNRLAVLSSPDTVYGYNNAHTGFGFYTILLDANGARHATETGGLISGFYTQIVGAAGRIYGTDGSIVDAARRVRVGALPVSGASIAVDPALGRAFVLTGTGVSVYDLNNFQLLGTVAVSGYAGNHPASDYPHIVRWGTDGIAFLDADEVFLLRSPLFGP